ncbi:glycosyl transferase family protein [Marinomonas ostreistagni]|uniref:Glycosyl transferase family protein n=1 Tax=Marinomonas ostreistagni TaxID=359209 RepID=A0ABS0ZDH4_9GAMM|nr:glycosyl transferase family protein [Marinomonas ostreistagni]MBJ7551734.1 glycosyl transferase family protein [Marinomonas ostreistagni]
MSMDFVRFVQLLGRGKRGARPLTAEEAELAMGMLLRGEVAPEQEGAFWMLIRIREETVDETLGFTRAVRQYLTESISLTGVDIDWPAYAGKRSELPWFLLAALALVDSGYKIVMHGHSFANEDRVYVDEFVSALGLSTLTDLSQQDAEAMLSKDGFLYAPLSSVSKRLAQMMDLKLTLGLRSPVNTVVRMMNPFNAKHSVHGVFHKGYDDLHAQACLQLKDPSVLIFRGGNGEAEINPERDVTLARVSNGVLSWEKWNRFEYDHTRNKNNLSVNRLINHWTGLTTDPFGEKAVLQTMAGVLGLVHNETDQLHCLHLAEMLWQSRSRDLKVLCDVF